MYDLFLAECPARTTLGLRADTWSVVVIFALSERPHRYTELRERIGGISKKMLTQTLRKLERNELVERRRIASSPPGVEYRLTEHSTPSSLSPWAAGLPCTTRLWRPSASDEARDLRSRNWRSWSSPASSYPAPPGSRRSRRWRSSRSPS